MITVENLTKKFGGVTAVERLSFQVNEGEVFGFLGPNGAGKTTTVRMLCCLISKTSGEARIADYQIGKATDSLQIRKMIGLVPDNVGLYDDLTAFENLDFYGKLYECPEARRKENIERFLKMLDLWERKDTRAGSFSKGMKQKLALARALVHEPKILFQDEPTANLDPESAKTVRDFILEIKKQGRTIFLNTHNLDEAQRICDRIGIIKTKLLTVGTPEQLRRSLLHRPNRISAQEDVCGAGQIARQEDHRRSGFLLFRRRRQVRPGQGRAALGGEGPGRPVPARQRGGAGRGSGRSGQLDLR